ncbi:MAG: HNH endonuclease, partial [Planctomycetes bacterium]|nr:HNH endonuclease [Planctomycetota bacterium]
MKERRNRRKPSLRGLVEARAGWRCEYCRAPQRVAGYRFHLDHILPSANGGSSGPSNRALACAPCNLAKIDRDHAEDPQTGDEVRL